MPDNPNHAQPLPCPTSSGLIAIVTDITFEVSARLRPVDLIAAHTRTGLTDRAGALPRPAPYAAVEAVPAPDAREARISLVSGAHTLNLVWRDSAVWLETTGPDGTQQHRSRRRAYVTRRPEALALTLTGAHLTAFTRHDGTWVPRARAALADRVPTRDEGWLAALAVATEGKLEDLSAGGFGQLGLRDVRIVTHADGTAVRDGSFVWFTATSAGPGFFDTAHTSVWRFDTHDHQLTHTGDIFFRRPDLPGVFGDHATHLIRDGDTWLVATSTWGDFVQPSDRQARRSGSTLRITLATTANDPRVGEHLLDTTEFPVPVDGFTSVGVWDPHLVRHGDRWWVGFVSASRFFRFHPVLAVGDALNDLELVAAATHRRATEGITLLPGIDTPLDSDTLTVLASDGRDGRRGERMSYPIFDTTLRQLGSLSAPYLTNIPWPTVICPPASQASAGALEDTGWLMLSFNGAAHDSTLLGYGTHGDLVVLTGTRAGMPG